MSDVLWSRDRPQRAHIGAGGGVLRRCPRAKGRPQKQAASGTPTGAPDGEPSNADRRPCARSADAIGFRSQRLPRARHAFARHVLTTKPLPTRVTHS